jgi:hypothetical protein
MRPIRLALLLPAVVLISAGCESTGPGDAATSVTGTGSSAASASATDASSRGLGGTFETVAGRSVHFDRGDYLTFVRDGRLWVFEATSEGLPEFVRTGEPAKSVTAVGVGPAGMSMRSDDTDTITGYLAHRDGYFTDVDENVVWVFEMGSAGMAEYLRTGEPAKNYTLVGAGPRGRSLRSDDESVLLGYLAARPGFRTVGDEGRIWIFREGSEALAEFERVGEPAKSFTMIGAGPEGRTLRSEDKETILEWMTAKPGFVTVGDEGRVWIFAEGSEALAEFQRVGEPAKSFTMIGAGPGGTTLRSEDKDTILRWMGSTPGFDVFAEDGRLWVFDIDSPASREYQRVGEPAKSITRIGVGPEGATVKSDTAEVLDRFLRSMG